VNQTSASINYQCQFLHKNYFNFKEKLVINNKFLKDFWVLMVKGLYNLALQRLRKLKKIVRKICKVFKILKKFLFKRRMFIKNQIKWLILRIFLIYLMMLLSKQIGFLYKIWFKNLKEDQITTILMVQKKFSKLSMYKDEFYKNYILSLINSFY